MSQRQIAAAYRRSLKTVYKHLTKEQYRLVKLLEQIKQHEKDLATAERSLKLRYGKDWRRDEEAKKDGDYDMFYWLLNDVDKLNRKASRLADKYGLDIEEVMRFHNRMNQAHSASMVGASAY